MSETREKKAVTHCAELWKRYENGRAWMAAAGMTVKLPKFSAFYEGRQWPQVTERTKDLPRPVVNVIKMIVRNKKGQILATPVRCLYQSDDEAVNADGIQALNDFGDYVDAEIQQEDVDREAVTQAAIKGCAVYHYYWDTEARGMDGRCEGGMAVELVDPLNFIVANPKEKNVQRQRWLMMVSREPVETVRLKCDKDAWRELVVPDESEDKSESEQDGTELCTVLTVYFRRNGEVYCEKAVRGTMVREAFPITPDVAAAEKSLIEMEALSGSDGKEAQATGEDPANAPSADDADKADEMTEDAQKAKARLYPVVVYQYEPREKSIYGLGEVEGLIPNQMLINQTLAMIAYHIMIMAWDKYVVSADALGDQEITNEPGQVICDFSLSGNGIRRLSAPAMSGSPQAVIDLIMGATRTVTGTTEVMSGETPGASMSGAAIAQLQSQAQVPSVDIRQSFWRAKEEQGRIKAQFFRLYYSAGKSYIVTRDTGELSQDGKPITERKRKEFSSGPYESAIIDVQCEATSGTMASAAGDITLLEALWKAGALSAEAVVRAYPKDAIGNRAEILKALRAQEEQQVQMLTAQLEQIQAAYEQAVKRISEMEEGFGRVEALIQANQRLQQLLGERYTEFAQLRQEAQDAITAANYQIEAGNQRIRELEGDATAFAGELARQYGMTAAQKKVQDAAEAVQ